MEPCTLMEPTSNKTTNFEKKKVVLLDVGSINVHGSIFVQTGPICAAANAVRRLLNLLAHIFCTSKKQDFSQNYECVNNNLLRYEIRSFSRNYI